MTTDPTLWSVIYCLRVTCVLTAYDCGQLGPDTARLVRSRSLTVGMPIGDHRALRRRYPVCLGSYMDRKTLELVMLTALSGLAWGTAFVIGHHIAVAVFAAITCAVTIITFALYRRVI